MIDPLNHSLPQARLKNDDTPALKVNTMLDATNPVAPLP